MRVVKYDYISNLKISFKFNNILVATNVLKSHQSYFCRCFSFSHLEFDGRNKTITIFSTPFSYIKAIFLTLTVTLYVSFFLV